MTVTDRWKTRDGLPSKDNGRGKRWRVRYRDPQGQQRARSFRLRQDADDFDLQNSVEVRTGVWADPTAGKQTFTAFAEHYVESNRARWRPTTERSQRQVIARTTPHLGLTPMARISHAQVQAMVDKWTKHYAPATVNLNVAALRTLFAFAVDEGVIGRDPSAKVKVPKRPRRRDAHLSHEDVDLILSKAQDSLRPFLASLAWCGLRLGEALGVQATDVDWLTATLHVRHQQSTEYANSNVTALLKTDAGRRDVPIPPTLVELASAQLVARRLVDGTLDGEWLWQSPRGGRMQRTTIDSEIRRIRRVTGVHFSAHHLRHYYGASLISAGVPIPQVAKMMGHASPQVTLRVYAYAMADDAEMARKAVSVMAEESGACVPDVYRTGIAGA